MSEAARSRPAPPASPAKLEARRQRRSEVTVELAFRREGGEPVRARTGNLSLGGAFIETATPAPMGATVVITLELPRSGPLRIQAVVRWTTAAGMGVQFGLMGARDTYDLTRALTGA